MKTFDELWNEFFDSKRSKKSKGDNPLKDDIKKLIQRLDDFNNSDANDEIEKEIENTLGKPHKIEYYNEGHIFFEKRIWHTPTGDVVKIIASDDPSLFGQPQLKQIEEKAPEKSAKDKLDEAVASENYEAAAKYRDIIKEENNKNRNIISNLLEEHKKKRKTKKKPK